MAETPLLDFQALLQPVPRTAVLRQPGWFVWGASMVRASDGSCHLWYARWPESEGFQAWVTHSEIAHAVASEPLGPYSPTGRVFDGAGGTAWDAEVTHNPSACAFDGRYYLYYMGTRGPGGWWDYRNRQRIGVAVADDPAGPWERRDAPLIDVGPDGAWDALMTSNPTCCQGADGRFRLLYKGVAQGPPPKGGAVLCGVATADSPTGPFVKHPDPVMVNPEHDWAVEDAFAWSQDGLFYCLIKDFQGYWTRAGKGCLALFWSADGIAWEAAPQPLAVPREIRWEDGTQPVTNLERPQLWLEVGRPRVLFAACRPGDDAEGTFNVHLPLG